MSFLVSWSLLLLLFPDSQVINSAEGKPQMSDWVALPWKWWAVGAGTCLSYVLSKLTCACQLVLHSQQWFDPEQVTGFNRRHRARLWRCTGDWEKVRAPSGDIPYWWVEMGLCSVPPYTFPAQHREVCYVPSPLKMQVPGPAWAITCRFGAAPFPTSHCYLLLGRV